MKVFNELSARVKGALRFYGIYTLSEVKEAWANGKIPEGRIPGIGALGISEIAIWLGEEQPKQKSAGAIKIQNAITLLKANGYVVIEKE